MQEYQYMAGPGAGEAEGSVLKKFSINLTEKAKHGLLDPIKCRDEEITKTLKILSRRKKNNALLIGKPGVGKSAIVEGIAQKIVDKDCSPFLHTKQVLLLDMTLVVAGTKFRGEFEERLTKIIDEVKENRDYILFIDEIHTIVGAGSASGSMDAANIIKPALARGEFQCIGATTSDEYKKHFREDKALDRRFQTVAVNEPTAEQTLDILKGLKKDYERFHKVLYDEEAIEASVDLANKYINTRFFPDKAIDLIDEAGASKKVETNIPEYLKEMENEINNTVDKMKKYAKAEDFISAAKQRDLRDLKKEQYRNQLDSWFEGLNHKVSTVTKEDIQRIISDNTGIPVSELNKSERAKLANLEASISKIVIGQDEAIEKISKNIRRNRFGLRDESKPMGSFMFIGSSGVGKTMLAKTIAKEIFGSEKNLIRVDMSEYQEKIDSSKIAGAAPGYVGYEEGGGLTEKVREKPYSIVLLDEIEKAHPDVFNTFLQVLDDGILTDNKGETVSFKNTIIIMTSNIGMSKLQQKPTGVGFGVQPDDEIEKNEILQKELKTYFKPEFLNRLDDIVTFNYLSEDNIKLITNNALNILTDKLLDKGYKITFTNKAKEIISKKGFNKMYGARPLNRTITELIESPITDEIFREGYESGEIKVTTQKDDLKINYKCKK